MRLVDLHCNWALQYACESTQYDPAQYAEIASRVGQVEGYLMGTSADLLFCGRRAGDWSKQSDPWGTLAAMITRYEAEVPGRLVLDPDDAARWSAEPADGLCWALLGIEGFDALVCEASDLDRISTIYRRGIRVFQLVDSATNMLGGSSASSDDDRGLTE